jgi:circadian clock protein KaiC
MLVGPGGISVFPRYDMDTELRGPPPPLAAARRHPSGVPGLDELCGGGLLERSVTLVSGSAGIGKSTLGLQFILEGARRKEPGLYVTLEEGPAQILNTAEGLGLSLKEAADKGLVEILYLSGLHVRASQLLSRLDDTVRRQKTRRLILDGVRHMAMGSAVPEELRQLLCAMVARLKACGVTSIFTLESDSMYSTDIVTGRGYSEIADNILVLRYARAPGDLQPTVAVVKTRGSAHDWGTHYFSITQGGIRIGERVSAGSAPAGKGRSTHQRAKRQERQ